jgi:tetratricopeptide (TPR) repeat protein
MIKRAVCLFITLAIINSVYAQEDNSLQEQFLEAEFFFMNEDYSDAIGSYLKLYEKLPDNANIAYRIGVCYLNIPGKKNLSVSFLETASKNISAKLKEGTVTENSAPYDALYELARAYRINYMFDKAKETFEKYSLTLLPDDRENRDFITHEITVCSRAKELIAKPVAFSEENLGEIINDEKANYNPLISSDGKTFAFMSALKFYDAVMLSKLEKGKWSAPLNITPELQIDGDIFISCLSSDGKMIFLSKDDNLNSDIYSGSFNGSTWTKAIRLNKNINTKYWESHGFLSDDGQKLIFASDRPGGFGGLDLYISQKVKGDWGPAVNMGPEINTEFNEERPFLIKGGKVLFFCSQGHVNMGGYDLFRSELQSNNLWSEPVNLGYPLNTPDDNTYFMPSADGNSGYCAVLRESGGYGKEDIYRIIFK